MPATSRQTAVGGASFSHGLGRLALEVDDLPAGRRMQRLAKMEVTVHALGIQRFGTQCVEAAQQPRTCGVSAGAISAASCSRSIMIIAVRAPSTLRSGKQSGARGGSLQAPCRALRPLARSLSRLISGEVVLGPERIERQVPAVDGACQLLNHHGRSASSCRPPDTQLPSIQPNRPAHRRCRPH